MKKFLALFAVIFFISAGLFFANRSSSDELDDLNSQINNLTKALNQSKAATAPLESELNSMRSQITEIKNRVAIIDQDLSVKRKNIDDGYKNLAKQENILDKAIEDYYIKSYYNSPLLTLFSASSAQNMTQILEYQKAATNQDKVIITNIALSIADLEQKKKDLESEQARLTDIKANLDQQSAKLDTIVSGAKAYQATLTNQIAQLSAKQQDLLAQKLAGLNIPRSAYTLQGGCVDDRGKDPGFSPRFAFFTYGVPNRVGLNQYGAKGRAEAGQSAQQILSAYYNADLISGYGGGINIHVTGTNEYGQSFDDTWSLDDYLKHLYEMPSDWPSEALKAQAIAARSYALAATGNGGSTICPSQSCQVVKRELNAQSWIDAVNATSGQVLTSGGSPIKAWFSSTHGGYVFTSGEIGWSDTSYTKHAVDTSSGSVNSFSDLQSNAYDRGSKWFYCDWGSRPQYSSTAWLQSGEVADIVNVLLLAKADSGTQKHLAQVDKPNPDGVDTWDATRVRQELQSRGVSAYSSISDVSVSWDQNSGKVTTVSVSGDGGSTSFSGSDFKSYFNLRAPANIQIVGPLFNAEKQ